jgi:para-nitrobenzyl esterase
MPRQHSFSLILAVLMTSSVLTGAASANTERTHKWFCTANGYDQTGQRRSISGDFFPTLKQAEQSAVDTCNSFGFLGCQRGACIDEGFAPAAVSGDQLRDPLVLSTSLADELTVEVEQGLVHGAVSGETLAFKGIPFAEPPIGALRWQKPVNAQAWSGVRDASAFGSMCLQTKNFDADAAVEGSEDCLTVNVWRPKDQSLKNLPVLFFIYGGAFSWGSSSARLAGVDMYDGAYLAAHGPAIVVTFNYRVGALGFLAHPALTDRNGSSGNYGLLDQIAALEWVQKNISSFGGDKSRVMIFGESAGAFSVLGLLTSPRAEGLFSRALMESGSEIRQTKTDAEATGAVFANSTQCASAADVASCLRSLSGTAIMKTSSSLLHGKGALLVFGPNIDGTLLPDFPLKRLQSGQYNHVPLLIGTNSDEMSVLSLSILKANPIFLEKDYEAAVYSQFGPALAPAVLKEYDRPNQTAYSTFKEVFADNIFHCPSQEIAELVGDQQPGRVFRYVFTHAFYLDAVRALGAGHAMEIPYVFHNFVPWYEPQAPSPSELAMSDQLVGYWTRFAATGDPNGGRAISWPSYGARAASYLELDTPLARKSAYRSEECAFWKSVGY